MYTKQLDDDDDVIDNGAAAVVAVVVEGAKTGRVQEEQEKPTFGKGRSTVLRMSLPRQFLPTKMH